MSEKIFDPLEKLRRNPKSLRAAINGKCWDCQGGDADPSPRWRIGNCECPDCPLYAVRPYQSNQSRPMPAVLRCDGAGETAEAAPEASGQEWLT